MLGQYAIVKAMQTILSMPNKGFSVRGLAAKAEISIGASKAALDFMKERQIVSREIVGRSHIFKANLESALCRQWKIVFNVDEIKQSGIVEELMEKMKGIQGILLFGSYAHGTNDEKSDIDILVITTTPAKAPALGKKTRKEPSVIVYSFSEWKKKAIENKAFYENAIFDSIVLFGERPVVF